MTTEIDTEPEKYAAEADVPMHLLDERLVRKMLRNAFAAGMKTGLQIALERLLASKEQK